MRFEKNRVAKGIQGLAAVLDDGESWPVDVAGALAASIEKWKFIVAHYETGEKSVLMDGGDRTCAFCRLFLMKNCNGCPVNEKTDASCDGTPYDDYRCTKNLTTAKAELEFLQSLVKP